MYNEVKGAFIAPPAEFTLLPFWFWNDRFTYEEIDRQIAAFQEKGVDGFVLHPRIGIPTDIIYLSDTFMDFVRHAVETAASRGMYVVLYDEAMYPSGSAHGEVVKENPAFASRGLRMEKGAYTLADGEEVITAVTHGDTAYTFIEGYTHGTIRGIHFGEDDGEPGAPPSTDLLNPAAVDTYIRLTHDRYYEVLHDYFGTTVIGMFTDEPSIMGRGGDARMQPWTRGFLDYYYKQGGSAEELLHCFTDIDETDGVCRERYKRAYSTMLGEVYFGKIGDWCTKHGIALCGHPGASDEIALLEHFDIPGQDLIFRRVAPENGSALEGVESVQAKCSADAARHAGKRRNLNECFACSGKFGEWSFNTDDMKWMTDWLLVRGVNMLVPHAFFYSMRDKRCDERPPDVGPNNLWWQYYDRFALYAKRMCYMLTDSVNQARVAVVCGPWALPHKSVKALYEHQTEFNYLEAPLLLGATVENGVLAVRNQRYTHLLIEDPTVLTAEMAPILEKFCQGGGTVSYDTCTASPDVTIYPHTSALRVSQIVKDGLRFYILVNEGETPIAGKLSLPNAWSAERWSPWDGTIREETLDRFFLDRRESVLLCVCESAYTETPTWTVEGKPITDFDWSAWEGKRTYSGSISYKTTVHVAADTQAVLDLGIVHTMAEVRVNGVSAGVCMWAPYTFTLSLLSGENVIEVIATNTLANHRGAPLPSGLTGAGTLKIRV